jgi:hypothetical protein
MSAALAAATPAGLSSMTTHRSLVAGAVGRDPGRSARRAVEPLGEFDDQALGFADVADEEGVLVVDDLPTVSQPASRTAAHARSTAAVG